tara:strand:- start:253 stop:906 length:654 start_codon:yes stop_codon:yes gene_type:complete
MSDVRRIITTQQAPHEQLEKTVLNHLDNAWQKPIADHTLRTFEATQSWLSKRSGDLILDSCCGDGESTRWLAKNNPEAVIIGLDKSETRLNRNSEADLTDNYRLVRADVNDFWRLAINAAWQPKKHCLLFPNPYPKPSQLNNRWYGSPAFPALVDLGGNLEVRTNWDIYITEFARSLLIVGKHPIVTRYYPEPCITAFERKYHNDGQELWRLNCRLS